MCAIVLSFGLIAALWIPIATPPTEQTAGNAVRIIKKLGGTVKRGENKSERPVVEVDLSKSKVSDRDLAVVRQLPRLRVLLLHETNLSDAGLKHIVTLTELRTLTLGKTRISNDGLALLAPLKKLRVLGLYGTAVTDKGMEQLKRLPRLRFLYVGSRLTDRGLETLAELSDLEGLWLGDSHVTDKGLAFLPKMKDLSFLNLDNTHVSDAGLQQLRRLPKLKFLYLRGTRVTDGGLSELLGLGELHLLDVRETKVTSRGLRRLGNLKHLEHILADRRHTVPGVTIAVGARVPDFTVRDLSGKKWKFVQLHRNVGLEKRCAIVLTFWCSFCESCRGVERDLDDLAKKYRGKAAVFALDASAGDDAKTVAAFAKRKGLKLPILLDAEGKTADIFGTNVTTTTVVIDANGVLRYCGQFAQGKHRYAEEALRAVLAGRDVHVLTTPHRG